jgi:hypothetical protein
MSRAQGGGSPGSKLGVTLGKRADARREQAAIQREVAASRRAVGDE